MKNLLKKYNEMDSEIKENLDLLYIYHLLLSISKEYKDIDLNEVNEREKLVQMILKCSYSTNLSIEDIITNILEVLNCQDITIEDLENLEINELLDIIFNVADEETFDEKEDEEIISEFTSRGYYCVFFKNKEQYFLLLIQDSHIDIIVFDNIEEILNNSVEQFLLEKKLYG